MALTDQEKIELKALLKESAQNQRMSPTNWQSRVSAVAHPVLETGGLMAGEGGGAFLGGLAGTALMGPGLGTAAGVEGGKVLGGGVGQATMNLGANELDTLMGLKKQAALADVAKQFGKQDVKGMEYSAFGRLLGAGAGRLAKTGPAQAAGRNLADLWEMVSGKPASAIKSVVNRAGSILPEWLGGEKSLVKAGTDYAAGKAAYAKANESVLRTALDKYGFDRETIQRMIDSGLDPKQLDAAGLYDEAPSAMKKMINQVDIATKSGKPVGPAEAITSHEWINSRLNKLKKVITDKSATFEQRDEFFKLLDLKSRVKNFVPDEFKPLIAQYARSSNKDAATSVFPSGMAAKYISRRALPVLAGFLSPKAALGMGLASSPLVTSGLTAAASSGMLNAPLLKAFDALRERRKQYQAQQDQQNQ
jgi:hypothetical protein